MKLLGFSYKQTSKVPIPLDPVSFVAQRAAYFRRLDELREAKAHLYYHDETWCNIGEEKRSVWLDEAGEGRIRKHDGKGKRLATSAMINETGFHKDTIDIFTADFDHSMVSWGMKIGASSFVSSVLCRIRLVSSNGLVSLPPIYVSITVLLHASLS